MVVAARRMVVHAVGIAIEVVPETDADQRIAAAMGMAVHRVGIAEQHAVDALGPGQGVVAARAPVKQLMRVAVGYAADIVLEHNDLITSMLVITKNSGRIAIDRHWTFPLSKRSALALI